MVMVINSNYAAHRERTASKMALTANAPLSLKQASIWENLVDQAALFIEGCPGKSLAVDWAAKIKARRLSYSGEVVATAQALSWEQIEAALPPKGACGRVPALDVSEGAVKRFLSDPSPHLSRAEGLKERPRPGRVLSQPGESLKIARGLLAHGIVGFVEHSDAVWIKGRPLTNGWFGVSKGVQMAVGRDILRLIMNLTATNTVFDDFVGEVATLPLPLLVSSKAYVHLA